MIRLHRGHDPESREARDVGTGDRLDVLDPVAPVGIAGRVRGGRPFVRVERHPDPGVADGVDLHLPAAPVGLGDEGVERVGVPFRPAGRRVVDVRIEHRGRARLDDAVGEGLEDAGVEPLPAAQVADERLVLVERRAPIAERPARLHRQRETRPHPQGAFVEERSPERDRSSGSTQASWIAVIPARCSVGDRPAHRVEGRRPSSGAGCAA